MALTPKNQLIFSITAVAKKLKTRNTETLRRAAPTHIFIEKSTSATKVVAIVTDCSRNLLAAACYNGFSVRKMTKSWTLVF